MHFIDYIFVFNDYLLLSLSPNLPKQTNYERNQSKNFLPEINFISSKNLTDLLKV